ncbi:MAG: PDGLE domain-containing protein [Nitrososphaeria archaeon]
MRSSKNSSLSIRKPVILALVLVMASPIFGVVLANIIGYHEPLDLAAEELGLTDLTDVTNWTPFLDYTIPGLPAEIGYSIAGLLGVGIILAIGFLLRRLVKPVEVKKSDT